jgi:cell division protease FtsH
MIFGDLTTGPSNDLQVIANLARDMVTKYGMSEKFGPVALESSGGRLIGGGYSEDRGYSLEVAKEIDEEVRAIISTAKSRAREILTKHRPALDAVAKRLIEVETLERDEYEAILKTEGVKIEDAYKDMRDKEERMGDPTKVLELTPDNDTLGGKE